MTVKVFKNGKIMDVINGKIFEASILAEDGIIKDIAFWGGCNGNLQGISKLVIGQRAEDVIPKIDGIRCGYKNTSCPDQLAKILKLIK